MKTCVVLFSLSFPFGELLGQKSIKLENPSFEADLPSPGKVPSGWVNLGAADQTPPDLFFGVSPRWQHIPWSGGAHDGDLGGLQWFFKKGAVIHSAFG
ncbi:MAG: hypothetical protein IPH31_09070 [Lewinellaceae bacterium]|nr:hypothetical protein [Lewinellaceae bacterium]